MIDWLASAYALFLNVLATLPVDWRVAAAGVVASLLLTQWLKHYLPDGWVPKERSLGAELVGVAIGATIVELYDPTVTHHLHAVIVGLAGPLAYRVTIGLLARSYPEVVQALSQDP